MSTMTYVSERVNAPKRSSVAVYDYVDSNGVLHTDISLRRVMVTAATDLAALPDIYAPGSEAYTADETGKWRLGADGTWESLIPEAAAET